MATKKSKKRSTSRPSNQKTTSLGVLFWIALILLAAILLLFNKEKIEKFVQDYKISKQTTNNTTQPSLPQESSSSITYQVTTPKENSPTKSTTIKTQPQEQQKPNKDSTVKKSHIELPPTKEKPQSQIVNIEEIAALADAKVKEILNDNMKIRSRQLYFLVSTDENPFGLQGISRQVPYEDSPLTSTLEALFSGIKASEFNQHPDLISAIPSGSKILSISVANSIATINLNSTFAQNPFAKEGHIASLKQIIYTATEFPTVTQVKILIEGKELEYLGPEGVYIKKPLNRNSF